MTEFRINVVVDPTSAKRNITIVRKELVTTEDRARRMGLTLKRAFQLAGGALILRQLVLISDAYTNTQNRIRTVVESQEELLDVQERLFDISNKTRASYEGTVEVYTRTAAAVRNLGLSQEQTLQFTESLNQAVALSGASANESQAALIQLSQGLASGALRGDELRSVLEQLPTVADVIAKSLGVTRGELRKMGEQGKITADVVIGAFRESREELQERFAKSVPTVSQALTVLRNELIKYVGESNEATGASEGLSNAILAVANNLETLIGVSVAAGGTLGAIKLAPLATGALETASAFVQTRIAVAKGTAVLLDSAKATKLKALADVAATKAVRDRAAAALQLALDERAIVAGGFAQIAGLDGVAGATEKVAQRRVALAVATDAATAAEKRATAATVAATLKARALALINPFTLAVAGATAFGFALSALLDKVNEYEAAALRATEAGERFALTDFGKIGADLQRTRDNLARIQENIDRDITTKGFANPLALQKAEEYRQRIQTLETQQGLLASGAAKTTVQAEEQVRAIEALAEATRGAIASIEQENMLLGLNSREREVQAALLREIAQLEKDDGPEVTATQREELKLALERNQVLREQAEVLDRINGPQQQFETDLRALNTLLAEEKITAEQYNAELAKLAENLQGIDFSNLQVSGIDPEQLRAQLEAFNQALANQPNTGGGGLDASLQAQADVLAQIKGPQEQYAQTQAALNALLEKGAISADEYTLALNNAAIAQNTIGSSATSGVQAGLAQIDSQLRDVGGTVQATIVDGFNAAKGALVDFVRTGKLDFSSFVNTVLDGLAELLVQQALLGIVGAAGGGGAGGLLSLFNFGGPKAAGGDVAGNKSYLVGEEGAELFTPKGAGKITPAGETAAMMNAAAAKSAQPIVNVAAPQVNVTNAIVRDEDEIPNAINSPKGEGAVLNLIQRNRSKVKAGLG